MCFWIFENVIVALTANIVASRDPSDIRVATFPANYYTNNMTIKALVSWVGSLR